MNKFDEATAEHLDYLKRNKERQEKEFPSEEKLKEIIQQTDDAARQDYKLLKEIELEVADETKTLRALDEEARKAQAICSEQNGKVERIKSKLERTRKSYRDHCVARDKAERELELRFHKPSPREGWGDPHADTANYREVMKGMRDEGRMWLGMEVEE